MPTLYIVATPIGNLEDVTLRALEVLRQVELIAAEDTRRTKHLLSKYEIKTPVTSYHEHNKRTKLPRLLQHLEQKDLALVSEAGMPGISDPGYELIAAAIERGFRVVPIPGPSAITTALAASGLPTRQFIYLGFLPRKRGERRKLLQQLSEEQRTLVAFESPYRLRAALEDLRDVLGERRLAIGRELTKLHEEIFYGTPSEALEHFSQPRGEFTLVIEGKSKPT
ncbi:MAG: 16S rRNA (cytidine(1402)-2'-O)-methyltransferase [Chloroflexi bacterium]|nr:MAG: 16S rRNA (cytidine(1402)-2'-O)-methyltransferase [Chloroflexota bacterium]